MEQIGSYEAKTHLPRLLERVANGERVTITRHGVPIAVLIPAQTRGQRPVAELVAELRRFRGGNRLDGLAIGDLVDEGRR